MNKIQITNEILSIIDNIEEHFDKVSLTLMQSNGQIIKVFFIGNGGKNGNKKDG